MADLPFHIADGIIVAVLVISGLLAYFRGFVKEILSVAGWIGAALVALYGFPYARPFARELIGHDFGADIATGAGLFVVTLMVLTVISHSIARGVRESSVGGLDKSLGFVFGLVRGAVLVCLIYIGASWFWTEEQLPDFVTQARAMPLVRGGADLLLTLVPEETRRKTEAATGSAKRKAETALKAERALRGLVRPTPQSTTGTKGYTRRQQRDMQRLIESKQ